MTSIHPITVADLDAWTELWNGYLTFYEASVPDAVTASTFRRLVADTELHGAIARDADGRAVGIVHWLTHPATWTTGDYTYLEDLFVAPDTRGGGVGRALIAHVTDWAREHGSAKVYWLTQESNETARRLYDRVAVHSGYTHYQVGL